MGAKPPAVRIGGVPHVLRLMRVETWDEHGRPETLFMAHEDEQVFELAPEDHSPQNHFITAYVPWQTVQPGANK